MPDLSKQIGGPKAAKDPSLHQAVGIPAAAAAAGVMASFLGAPQMPLISNAPGAAGRGVPMADPLTVHLAGLSRYQLYEIIHLMKVSCEFVFFLLGLSNGN
jgi:cleavage stimulation factor subunit 2